jgi:hypothetical protein
MLIKPALCGRRPQQPVNPLEGSPLPFPCLGQPSTVFWTGLQFLPIPAVPTCRDKVPLSLLLLVSSSLSGPQMNSGLLGGTSQCTSNWSEEKRVPGPQEGTVHSGAQASL